MPRNRIYREVDGVHIPGTSLQAFIKNGRHYFVADINIYKDGLIWCWEQVDFEGFKACVRRGWVRTQLPEGARVSMMTSGLYFDAVNVKSKVEEEEFIKEVEDEIRRLNKQPTTLQICEEAMSRHRQNPTEETIEQLRITYEAVPKHLRTYLGDMDSKDWEYKQALGVT